MRILFLGEGDLAGPARYLAAVLRWSKIPFDHRPDQARLPKSWRKRKYGAVLLSDYRYSAWTPCAKEWLAMSVQQGMGLLMIGGWASFTGQVGGYARTDIERLLPVRCIPGDDRVNRPAVLKISNGISLVVNGYHKVRPKPDSRTVLEFQDLTFSHGRPVLGSKHPALVTGTAGRGRTAAFMTDAAPHWAGGLIDWGNRRAHIQVSPGVRVETGTSYLQFFRQWLLWVSRRP